MAVPVVWANQILGVLTVTTIHSRLFDPSHLNLLELVAHNMSLALHSATLNDHVKKLMNLLAESRHDLQASFGSVHYLLQHLLPEQPDVPDDTQISARVGDLRALATALAQFDTTRQQIQQVHAELSDRQ
jgi:transcriptional regulator with GAF, ATPase, and Fis domain